MGKGHKLLDEDIIVLDDSNLVRDIGKLREKAKEEAGQIIVTLQARNDYSGYYHRIDLFKVPQSSSVNTYKFEIQLQEYSPERYYTTNIVSSDSIKLLFNFIERMNLPINPYQESWEDTSSYLLYIHNQKYEWCDPIPEGWEPLELIVKWIEVLSELNKFSKYCQKKSRLERYRILNKKQVFHYDLPNNYKVLLKKVVPAGMFYRIKEATDFVKMDNLYIELEREYTNEHDSNAIKIIGCSKDDKYIKKHIGYLPREVSAAIVKTNLFEDITPNLVKTYFDDITKNIEVYFDLIISKNKKSIFEQKLYDIYKSNA